MKAHKKSETFTKKVKQLWIFHFFCEIIVEKVKQLGYFTKKVKYYGKNSQKK
jgi:hypothetical protein